MIQQYHSWTYNWRNVCQDKMSHLHTHVCYSTIYNSQALETTQMYHNWWIQKMWYVYTTKFHSALKKNEIMLFVSKWMELENIILTK
jgi:hypothetical protein